MRTNVVSDGLVTIPLGEDLVPVEEAEGERTYLPLALKAAL